MNQVEDKLSRYQRGGQLVVGRGGSIFWVTSGSGHDDRARDDRDFDVFRNVRVSLPNAV